MNPYFYVIVPDEIPDLSGPKLAAQVAHAQAKVTKVGLNKDDTSNEGVLLRKLYAEWEGTLSFGTTIILVYKGNFNDLAYEVNNLLAEKNDQISHIAAAVTDPTYPIRNFLGRIYTESRATCIGILVDKDHQTDLNSFIASLNLYPS